MATDSRLFVLSHELLDTASLPSGPGKTLIPQVFAVAAERGLLPLYEAKLLHHFDHRWASYGPDGREANDVTEKQKADPTFRALPRYWIDKSEVEVRLAARGWTRGWLLGWRDITSACTAHSHRERYSARGGQPQDPSFL